MLVIDWLKWYFIPHGIVYVEESGVLSWCEALKRFFSGAVKRHPDGPTLTERALWERIHKPLRRYKCRVCSIYFWGWRKRQICHKFSCYRRRCV